VHSVSAPAGAPVYVEEAMSLHYFAIPAILVAGVAAAQGSARPDPADSRASVPPVEYRSAFEGYRPYADQPLRDWRKSNDEVGAAGGHAGHRPAQNPGVPPAGSKAAPAQQGHGGHK
jgi:hypothetical protein